jgi:hypothetical protein
MPAVKYGLPVNGVKNDELQLTEVRWVQSFGTLNPITPLVDCDLSVADT